MIRKKHLSLLAWGLFTAGSGIYLAESLINRNFIAATGSFAFLVACIIFIIIDIN